MAELRAAVGDLLNGRLHEWNRHACDEPMGDWHMWLANNLRSRIVRWWKRLTLMKNRGLVVLCECRLIIANTTMVTPTRSCKGLRCHLLTWSAMGFQRSGVLRTRSMPASLARAHRS